MKIGDRLVKQPYRDVEKGVRPYTLPCVVVALNEAHGFYVVEFEGKFGVKFRETFYLENKARPDRKEKQE